VLTKEIAEQFLEDEYSVDILEFTAIEDAAAESLRKHRGRLDFESLTSLSDAAAESLSKVKRLYLNLDDLPMALRLAESAVKILRDAGHG